MAQNTLPAPAREISSDFPQAQERFQAEFARMIASCLEFQIAYVTRVITTSYLRPCQSDFPCSQLATVHDLQTELEYCGRHWKAVTK